MLLHLCSSLAEIAHRLTYFQEPLAVSGVINFAPPTDWTVGVTFDDTGRTNVTMRAAEASHAFQNSISAAYLPLFLAERIELSADGEIWVTNWRAQFADSPNCSALSFARVARAESAAQFLRLVGYCGSVLPAEFSDSQRFQAYLSRHTWFGSKGVAQNGFSVTLHVVSRATSIRNRWRLMEAVSTARSEGRPVLDMALTIGNPAIGTLHVTKVHGQKKGGVAWTHCGTLTAEEVRQLFGRDLGAELVGADVEISFPGYGMAPDGSVARDEVFQQLTVGLRNTGHQALARGAYKQFENECLAYDRKQGAIRIDRRKHDLEKADFAYWRDKVVYKAPTNEMELVALHQKLEGLGAVPFKFESLEYTPKIGIDAIANFKLDESHPMTRLGTVEFEHDLRNYFDHEHAVEHTDLIVW